MMLKKKRTEVKTYNHEELYPIIRSSICTGEKVAGFKRRDNGKFEEIMLIQNERDMAEFLRMYGLDKADVKVEY